MQNPSQQPSNPQNQGLFAKQEEDLERAYEKLKKTTRNKIRKINEGKIVINEKDPLTTKIKKKIDDEVEALHLAVSNFYGDCDKRKQKIEAEISEKVDFEGFGKIADNLLAL